MRIFVIRLFSIFALAAIFAGSATAADRIEEAHNVANDVETQPFSWEGNYLGLQIGAAHISDTYTIPGLGVFFTGSTSGMMAGAYAGKNWQKDNFVVGLEADILGANISLQNTGPFAIDFKTRGFASLNARFGIAMDRWLAYGTVGAAYNFNDHKVDLLGTGFDFDDSAFAPIYGAGLEYALTDDTFVRISYRYMEVSSSHAPSQTLQNVVNGHSRDFEMHLVTAGISRRF